MKTAKNKYILKKRTIFQPVRKSNKYVHFTPKAQNRIIFSYFLHDANSEEQCHSFIQGITCTEEICGLVDDELVGRDAEVTGGLRG